MGTCGAISTKQNVLLPLKLIFSRMLLPPLLAKYLVCLDTEKMKEVCILDKQLSCEFYLFSLQFKLRWSHLHSEMLKKHRFTCI